MRKYKVKVYTGVEWLEHDVVFEFEYGIKSYFQSLYPEVDFDKNPVEVEYIGDVPIIVNTVKIYPDELRDKDDDNLCYCEMNKLDELSIIDLIENKPYVMTIIKATHISESMKEEGVEEGDEFYVECGGIIKSIKNDYSYLSTEAVYEFVEYRLIY